MDQRFVTKNFQENVGKTAAMPGWKMQNIIKQKAKEGNPDAIKAKNLLGKKSLSTQEARGFAGAAKKLGILKHVGVEQMVSRVKRQMAEEAKAAAKETAGKTAKLWRTEEAMKRAAEAKGKKKAETSIWATAKISHSAKEGQENVAKGEKAFVSASRAQQQTKPPTEKQKESVAVDMFGREDY